MPFTYRVCRSDTSSLQKHQSSVGSNCRANAFHKDRLRHLTGQETEPWEIIYFKLYKSQLAVIEQALETAALMLGTDKSRGYCLEMICADFLAGASLEARQENTLFLALARLIGALPAEQKLRLLGAMRNDYETAPPKAAAVTA